MVQIRGQCLGMYSHFQSQLCVAMATAQSGPSRVSLGLSDADTLCALFNLNLKCGSHGFSCQDPKKKAMAPPLGKGGHRGVFTPMLRNL